MCADCRIAARQMGYKVVVIAVPDDHTVLRPREHEETRSLRDLRANAWAIYEVMRGKRARSSILERTLAVVISSERVIEVESLRAAVFHDDLLTFVNDAIVYTMSNSPSWRSVTAFTIETTLTKSAGGAPVVRVVLR